MNIEEIIKSQLSVLHHCSPIELGWQPSGRIRKEDFGEGVKVDIIIGNNVECSEYSNGKTEEDLLNLYNRLWLKWSMKLLWPLVEVKNG